MKKIALLTLAAVLASCGKSEGTDTADFLVKHPDRLRIVERACSDDRAKEGAAECNAASQARRILFMGRGPQYTPPKDAPKF